VVRIVFPLPRQRQRSVACTFRKKTTLGLISEATYDWEAEQWKVPLNLTVSQLLNVGKVPLKLTLGGRIYLEGPEGGPDWDMRFTMTFLFPK